MNEQPARAQQEADVLVIGGGLHGTSSAFHLARRGASVIVLEADYVARHSSGVNAGGVRTLGRPLPEIPLALRSRELWHTLPELIGDDGGFVPSGQLKIAETDAELDECRERVALLNAHGFTHETLIDRERVLELEPALARHVTGGIWVERDGYALPYRTTTAFRLAAQRLGARFIERTPVARIEPHGERWLAHTPRGTFAARQLLVAAGAWSGELARQAGEPVPVHPEGLMLMVTQRVAPFCRATLGATGRPLSFKQFDNGTVVIGGKLIGHADLPGRHGEVDFMRLVKSARTVVDLFPHLRDLGVNRAWAGVEAFTDDALPVISASRTASGLYYSFGYCGSGFQLGPACGQVVSELMLDGAPSVPLDAFAIDRFGRETREAPSAAVDHAATH
ncbi:NAD(P)/FAD-dependent oxidoreductase [Paraburkholderia tropica]|uniref:Glycine/D-amino acid oxidase-like deaminating enzyme n=1 Tax=Paraburkholderia tropica TaxID=92647 RepID=A0ABX5MTH5_9BURK|nr:FAD-binding oxidoreductase [Paraburkholderia tropica]MBB3000689.1 sarcosine oxidase subunit beta [Paraburkholderia tropica]MBB6320318.1 sarcosine oxidase subunit beta [Paraburkholderia tropica]MDE1143808.1 FAD-binding oxidoreductase [Paraburkholderia tropica]PXX17023.1 glycine/D-amino acid oxidase-like deaminating enzyme [Paraburkholderia tropica]PZW83834.1 glycine/D-amino acid oxidase-like deaminating enzyme [Paraburkholderia tropica]